MTRKATCCCGGCAIEVEGEPEINAICHCRNCKKRTGSAFGWSAYFRDDHVLVRSGKPSVYRIAGESEQRRWFCTACGSTLFWQSAYFPGLTGIAGGCFADAPLPEPSLTVSNDERCAWIGLPDAWQTSL